MYVSIAVSEHFVFDSQGSETRFADSFCRESSSISHRDLVQYAHLHNADEKGANEMKLF